MRILVAGATGAIGRQLVPQLATRGHEVTGTTATPAKVAQVRGLGATPVVMDGLDAESVARVVAEATPEVIVHQLTALGSGLDLRRFDRTFATTNRLRTEGTDHLLAAGRAVGVQRFVAQSFTGWPYARTGGAIKTEADPLDPDPVPAMRETLAAIRHLEAAVTGATWTAGVVLRYGGFSGPGTGLNGSEGEQADMIRKRRIPVIGDGGGVWSFVDVRDAAAATVAAIERGRPGIYNIVDDHPAPVREWLPALADALGAKPPRRIPLWLGRLAGGQVAATMMTDVRGASNAKAKRELGWAPEHPTWRRAAA